MPSGNKPLSKPMLTKFYVTIWHHKATMSWEMKDAHLQVNLYVICMWLFILQHPLVLDIGEDWHQGNQDEVRLFRWLWQDWGNSRALAMELPLSCIRASILMSYYKTMIFFSYWILLNRNKRLYNLFVFHVILWLCNDIVYLTLRPKDDKNQLFLYSQCDVIK